MGNTCSACGCDRNQLDNDFPADANYGLDENDVTESYQYHPTKLAEFEVKLSLFDKFYREACSPMQLMTFQVFNTVIDELAAS